MKSVIISANHSLLWSGGLDLVFYLTIYIISTAHLLRVISYQVSLLTQRNVYKWMTFVSCFLGACIYMYTHNYMPAIERAGATPPGLYSVQLFIRVSNLVDSGKRLNWKFKGPSAVTHVRFLCHDRDGNGNTFAMATERCQMYTP